MTEQLPFISSDLFICILYFDFDLGLVRAVRVIFKKFPGVSLTNSFACRLLYMNLYMALLVSTILLNTYRNFTLLRPHKIL